MQSLSFAEALSAPRLPRVQRRSPRTRAAATSEGSGVELSQFVVVARARPKSASRGKSHCFEKVDNRLVDRFVIEPITPASLESMQAGAPTSFLVVAGVTVEDVLEGIVEKLPAEFAGAAFCDDWRFRLECCARTWNRPYPREKLLGLVPLGTQRKDWNFSLQDKRVLNFENVVTDADNVKQDISIDVYGRSKEDS